MTPQPFLTRTLPWLLLAIICAGALRIRLNDPYDAVFTGDEIVLRSNDPWYHLRLTEHLLHNFPHRITLDPYAKFPNGQDIGYAPLLDIVGAVLLRLGGGMMSLVLLPAIAGSLIAVPVFLIGRQLWNPWAGLLAAAIVVVVPGQFMTISMVGFYDHHVFEALFSTITALLWMRRSNWTGVALALYLLSWQGGSIFVAILLASLLAVVEIPPFVVRAWIAALVILAPFMPWGMVVVRPAIAVAAALAATIALRAVTGRIARAAIAAAGIAVMFAGVFQAAQEHVSLLDYFTRGPNVWEIRPLLFSTGSFSLKPAYAEFGLASFFILPALVILAWKCRYVWARPAPSAAPDAAPDAAPNAARRRAPSPEIAFLTEWSFAWFVATLMMRRHSYYFVVNVGLLTAYCFYLASRYIPRVLACAAAVALPLLMIPAATRQAGAAGGPPKDWREALLWMRDNTPQPFGRDLYLTQFGESRAAIQGAYGVMVWGAEGFWVTTIAHRIPVDNPTWSGSRDAAAFYTAPTEAEGNAVLDRLRVRYVIAPMSVALQEGPGGASASGEFPVMSNWIGRKSSDYVEVVRMPNGRQKIVYYPAYFTSMAARLCIFKGRAVDPAHATVLAFDAQHKVTYKRDFTNYAEALQDAATHFGSRIVSLDPMESPVPLASLEARYRLVHQSPSEVAIYEYLDSARAVPVREP